MAQPIESQPHDSRYCRIQGLDYNLPWDKTPVGGSFFLPLVGEFDYARRVIRSRARQFGVPVAVHLRCEYGILGVRVWRIIEQPA